jgi:glycosyltransferase involved in cell wall biosynthesis
VFLGRLILTEFHNSRVPIWGIGQFAVEGYQKEFGSGRTYNNLPYFSDLTRFQCTTRNGNGKSEERVFLFSGSLIRRKGVDLLGRAFLRLAREMPAVRLKLMGSGELQNKLIQMLEPVQTQVEFLGFKDWSELPDYYAQSHVLCVPSRYDGWGLVVPEGLASGLPVIGTTQMGAALELIKTGRNGWLIPAGDEAAIYTAMRNAAMLSPTELSQLSCNARESVIEHSLEQGAERFIHAARDAYSQW